MSYDPDWAEKARATFIYCSDHKLVKNLKETLLEIHRRGIDLDEYKDDLRVFQITTRLEEIQSWNDEFINAYFRGIKNETTN